MWIRTCGNKISRAVRKRLYYDFYFHTFTSPLPPERYQSGSLFGRVLEVRAVHEAATKAGGYTFINLTSSRFLLSSALRRFA